MCILPQLKIESKTKRERECKSLAESKLEKSSHLTLHSISLPKDASSINIRVDSTSPLLNLFYQIVFLWQLHIFS